MTVAELIEKLKSMPQNARVIVVSTENGLDKFDQTVRDVIYNDTNSKVDPHTVELDNWPPAAEMFANDLPKAW